MEEDLENRNQVSFDKLIQTPSNSPSKKSNKVGITNEADAKKKK